MKKLNPETVEKAVKMARAGLSYLVMVKLLSRTDTTCKSKIDEIDPTYSGAIKAIMDSSMLSGDKQEAVAALTKIGNKELYRAVANVVNSSALSGDKVVMIQSLCKDE